MSAEKRRIIPKQLSNTKSWPRDHRHTSYTKWTQRFYLKIYACMGNYIHVYNLYVSVCLMIVMKKRQSEKRL